MRIFIFLLLTLICAPANQMLKMQGSIEFVSYYSVPKTNEIYHGLIECSVYKNEYNILIEPINPDKSNQVWEKAVILASDGRTSFQLTITESSLKAYTNKMGQLEPCTNHPLAYIRPGFVPQGCHAVLGEAWFGLASGHYFSPNDTSFIQPAIYPMSHDKVLKSSIRQKAVINKNEIPPNIAKSVYLYNDWLQDSGDSNAKEVICKLQAEDYVKKGDNEYPKIIKIQRFAAGKLVRETLIALTNAQVIPRTNSLVPELPGTSYVTDERPLEWEDPRLVGKYRSKWPTIEETRVAYMQGIKLDQMSHRNLLISKYGHYIFAIMIILLLLPILYFTKFRIKSPS